MRVTLKDVEENIKPLGGRLSYDKEFIFELLTAYGRSQNNITRLRNGQLNVADDKANEVAQKGIVYLKPADVPDDALYTIVDDLKTSPTVVRYSTRFVIATNYHKLLAIDTKTGEPLDINLEDIHRQYAYFLPWAGMEKTQFIAENHADVKAAEKMAKLFDTLIAYNNYKTAYDWHCLTIFFTRLLFCFFAEDTGIFQKNQFANAIGSYTQDNGSDMHDFLLVLFETLDDEDKDGYPAYLAEFPYVNGNLFSKDSALIPRFNKEARNLLIESSSKLDWSNINPDIFGSMFQAVVRPGERTGLGQHYTSVPNIMKAIEPLFLDGLKDDFDKAYDDNKKLERLLGRISQIKVFDPACGSGNFLIIAYKELRKLEHAILERQSELTGRVQQALLGSRVNIENFYGIEIDDFAHEVAILSLWLAKHQMNIEFTEKFGIDLPLIPLRETGNIVRGNAATLDWTKLLMPEAEEEVYLIGNPPYAGSGKQNERQKRDIGKVLGHFDNYKNLDYVAIWFYKGSQYIKDKRAKLAFVSTNSICQGEQVGLLWPHILSMDIGIEFAYTSFKWTNNARNKAGVICIIVSLSAKHTIRNKKPIFSEDVVFEADNISPYLIAGDDVIIYRRSKPLAALPEMTYGNKPVDGGHLILESHDRYDLFAKYPNVNKFIRHLYGSKEYLNGIDRWCLWIPDNLVEEAYAIPEIVTRINKTKKMRLDSKDAGANKLASKPHQFREMKTSKYNTLIVPRVTSERREYLIAGYLAKHDVVLDSAQAVYDADFWVFGVLSSKLHILWAKIVCGRLKSDLRYSSALAYNNFPMPTLTEKDKKSIEEKGLALLDTREHHTDKTLSELYSPDKMPGDLRIAHQELDEVVEKAYRNKPFENDEERLAYLFDLYKTTTAKEDAV